MACERENEWSENTRKINESNIKEWEIEQGETRSIGLGIYPEKTGHFKVYLFKKNAITLTTSTLATFETKNDAIKFANIFMRIMNTWDEVRLYFEKSGFSRIWDEMMNI